MRRKPMRQKKREGGGGVRAAKDGFREDLRNKMRNGEKLAGRRRSKAIHGHGNEIRSRCFSFAICDIMLS
jgi:hypothetical protein